MQLLLAIAAFLGAWLLVAGPVYQAAVELGEEQFERDEFERVQSSMPAPRRVSPWWWLLPPVAYLLQRRRGRAYRREFLQRVPKAQLEQFVSFTNKATGWLLVGAGAFLLAIRETWELREAADWPAWTFWLLLVGALLASVAYTVVKQQRAHEMLQAKNEPSARRLSGVE